MTPPTPRLFIIRHGETEWSLNGRHTGVSDIPLTANGERRIRSTGRALVGADRLIVPQNLAAIFVSPRHRARRTLELLVEEGLCHHADIEHEAAARQRGGKAGLGARKINEWLASGKVEVRDDVREWDYGRYEGARTHEIQAERAAAGLPKWQIWRDGCPDGESPAQISARLDGVIAEIRRRFHAPALAAAAADDGAKPPPSDVLVVAHGHVLRALAGRWVGGDIADNPNLLLEAGGVGTLSYEHRAIDEPAIMLGGAFVVDVVDEVEAEAEAAVARAKGSDA